MGETLAMYFINPLLGNIMDLNQFSSSLHLVCLSRSSPPSPSLHARRVGCSRPHRLPSSTAHVIRLVNIGDPTRPAANRGAGPLMTSTPLLSSNPLLLFVLIFLVGRASTRKHEEWWPHYVPSLPLALSSTKEENPRSSFSSSILAELKRKRKKLWREGK